jgi:hypothetical protein
MRRPRSARISGTRLEQARVVAVGLVAVLGSVIVGLWWLWDIRSPIDFLAYREMICYDHHPIWKDLAWRHLRKGDPIEKVLKRHPPLWREDFPPYTALRYHEVGSSDRLVIGAKDGKLISAAASSDSWPRWTHFFFGSPEDEKSFNKAYSAYAEQRILESQAFKIHETIKNGQDVFLARPIDPRGMGYSGGSLRELADIYGEDYLRQMGFGPCELTVEVTTVLHGDLQVGTELTFSVEDCCLAEAHEPDGVFLHVDDIRLLYPLKKAREGCVTVPRKALDWYQSLTPGQVKDLEAQGLARQSEDWQPEKPLTRPPQKTEPQPAPRGGLSCRPLMRNALDRDMGSQVQGAAYFSPSSIECGVLELALACRSWDTTALQWARCEKRVPVEVPVCVDCLLLG